MECADVLKHGIFNIVKIKSYEHSVSQFYEFIMNADETEAREATNAGIDLSIPVEGIVVPLKGNFSDTEWTTWSKKRQHLVKSDLTKTLIVDSFSRIADKAIVEAWSKCMSEYFKSQADKNHLILDVSKQTGKLIPVIVELRVPGIPVVKAVITDWSVDNATLQSGVVPKVLQGMEPVQVVYERTNPQEDVVIAIQTTRGTLFEIIPPPPQPTQAQTGQDFGSAAETKAVSVTSKLDQVIRVWGGCVAAYEQSGDPEATMWLYEDKIGGVVAYQRGPVTMGMNLDGLPLAHLHNRPFRGTVVGEFDFKVAVKAGESRTYIGHTKNHHAQAVAFLIFIDYLEPPK